MADIVTKKTTITADSLKSFIKNLIVTVTVLVVSFILGLIGPMTAHAAGPAPVDLGSAGNFAILAKTAITSTGTTLITGNVGLSPAAGSKITGLSCTEITGTLYDVDGTYTGGFDFNISCFAPGPGANKTLVDNAVLDMETAYTNAAGRAPGVGPNLNVGGGTLNGQNFAPGTYTWNTPGNVSITGDITLTGDADDVWIFQITGTLSIEDGKKIILGGNAQDSNIFWQVAGTTTLKPGSTFKGNILAGPGASTIAGQDGAILNGRALGQTDVTLIANTVSIPTTTNEKFLGEIRGTKYEDGNGNGCKNSGERGLSGWTIYLDTNNNGAFDSNEPSAITDSQGNYRFLNRPAGTYTVREEVQSGWMQTYPSGGSYTIVLASGQIAGNKNFGNFKFGSISGMKFEDKNGNGRKDSGEDGLSGWTIQLKKLNGSTITTGTNTDGSYSFSDLGPGTYQVREVQQPGWVQTTNNPPNITMRSGTVSANNNFGNHFGPVKKNYNCGAFFSCPFPWWPR